MTKLRQFIDYIVVLTGGLFLVCLGAILAVLVPLLPAIPVIAVLVAVKYLFF